MQFIWNDLIGRSRVYVDDDHKEVNGWIAPASWLTLMNVEYAQLRRKWTRMGLVRDKPTETKFTSTVTLNGVLAVVGVGEDRGTYVRTLDPAQSISGADPFWQGSTPASGMATRWAVHGGADDLTIELDPPDTTTGYTVRWIPSVPYATDPTAIVNLPYGGDEVLVLGAARRALVKESSRSQAIEALLRDAEAELNFEAFGRAAGGPRVRRSPTRPYRAGGLGGDRAFSPFPVEPRYWYYP